MDNQQDNHLNEGSVSDKPSEADQNLSYVENLILELSSNDDSDDEFVIEDVDMKEDESENVPDELDDAVSDTSMETDNEIHISQNEKKDDKDEFNWRMDPAISFSDWTIDIICNTDDNIGTEGEGQSTTIETYNVHKNYLAAGPRKSGYFLAVLSKGEQLQECSQNNSKSTITLSTEDAKLFPTVLDYIYSSSRFQICTENVLRLRSLAKYFAIPSLEKLVVNFIKTDMSSSIERVEFYYLVLRNHERDDDMDNDWQELLAYATEVCVKKYKDISDTFLYAMTPAFFLHLVTIVYERQGVSTTLKFTHLITSYCSHHNDKLTENYLRCLVPFEQYKNLRLGYMDTITFLNILKVRKWKSLDYFENHCIDNLSRSITGSANKFTTEILHKLSDSATTKLINSLAAEINKSKQTISAMQSLMSN